MSKINEKVCESCWDEEDKRLDFGIKKSNTNVLLEK